jgi:AcrR family transcriptional regulator
MVEREPGDRAQAILDEAESMAVRHGYRRFNLDALARRLRVSKKTIYTCYPSKEELFFAALNRRASRLVRKLKEVLKSEKSARDKLYLASDLVARDLSELDVSLMRDLEELFPDFYVVSQGYFRQLTRYISAILEEGARRGEFREGISPVLLTRLFQGIGDYLGDREFLERNRLNMEKVYSGTMDLLMQGILK